MTEPRTYKVLLLEPSEIVSAGFRKILTGTEFRLTGAERPNDLSSALEHIRVLDPDIVVVNPSVFDIARRSSLRAVYPQLRGTVLVAIAYSVYGEDMLREFDGAINIFDTQAQVVRKLRQAFEQNGRSAQSESYELSDREREILISIARGKTNKEIAEIHSISIHTVISHRKNISRKTGIKTIAGLTVYALLNNMIAESDMA